MKKKLSLLAMSLFAMFLFPLGVDAASFRLDCNPSDSLSPGDSTTCTIRLIESSDPITAAIVDITNEDMTIAPFQANSSAWSSTDQGGSVILSSIAGGTTAGDLGNFVATLNNDARDCGKICVSVRYTTAAGEFTADMGDQGCVEPGEPTPPSTGILSSYGSYVILAGGAVIALAAISLARKSTKFYRV